MDAETNQLADKLPQIAAIFRDASVSIYNKVLLPQFQDYEERYGPGLVSQINDKKRAALIATIQGYMLHTFFRLVEERYPEQKIALPMTHFIGEEIDTHKAGGVLFLDYVNYQNPNFEEVRMASAFKFGNDIGKIVGTVDRPFTFMASQQAMIVSEITKKLLNEMGPDEHSENADATLPHKSKALNKSVGLVFTASNGSGKLPSLAGEANGRTSSAAADAATGVAYFGWWLAWGVFTGILILIPIKGGGLPLDTQVFVVLGIGVLSGSSGLFYYVTKKQRAPKGHTVF